MTIYSKHGKSHETNKLQAKQLQNQNKSCNNITRSPTEYKSPLLFGPATIFCYILNLYLKIISNNLFYNYDHEFYFYWFEMKVYQGNGSPFRPIFQTHSLQSWGIFSFTSLKLGRIICPYTKLNMLKSSSFALSASNLWKPVSL